MGRPVTEGFLASPARDVFAAPCITPRCACSLSAPLETPSQLTASLLGQQGLQSPGGYYTVAQPVGQVTYTFWFQLCSNMEFSRADPGRPGVREQSWLTKSLGLPLAGVSDLAPPPRSLPFPGGLLAQRA